MQKEELPLLVYEFFFQVGQNNTYVFETNASILYGIKFKTSDYVIPDKSYSSSIYEMVIEVLEIPVGKKLNIDKVIPPTVATIIKDFFTNIKQPIVIYICDSSDNKQLVRLRKFNQWFEEFADSKLTKTEFIFVDENHIRFPISLFLEISHPDVNEILALFILEAKKSQNEK